MYRTYLHKSFLAAFLPFALCLTQGCGNGDETVAEKQESLKQETAEESNITNTQGIAGTYAFGDNVEEGPVGKISVYPESDSSALFYLDVTRGAPSYNLGQLYGRMKMQDSIGIYDSSKENSGFNCKLKFQFSNMAVDVSTVDGYNDCGFGNAVNVDNTYKRETHAIPEYFINGQGDTIQFQGVTPETYNAISY